MMINRESNGCSSVIQGSFAGIAKGMMTMSHLHSQHKESIAENMSPRSVLEHRALSGLAIAIDLEEEEKKNKSPHAEHHVVFVGRYCCRQNIQLMGAGREGNLEHNFTLGSVFSRERLTPMNRKEQETDFDGGPVVGLRMVTSLYPLLNLSNSEANRGHLNLVMGRSLSPERGFMPEVAMSYGGERKQGDVCNRGMEVSMSSSLPLQTANSRGQLHTRKSTACRYDKESFLGGRSTEESIFYYENPSSSNALCTVVGDNDLSCFHMVNFLKVCALCKCRLGVAKDIYMYRGDQAFCSAECRDQRMMTDECMDL